ncbi:hypothetical protein CDD83_5863 [Cordyceps sp. RAO-2017]|nr:hypothetical protein CDD83_5863 [Cordyceps sp. RAO-2017]
MVTMPAGRVMGQSTGTTHNYFGIPFAAPPERFEPPRAARRWKGTYDATRHKPACVQKFRYPHDARNRTMSWFNSPPPPGGESEDCLYLNVFAPAGATSGSNKAVMFWVFGGGFSFGSGMLPLYDGTSFAENQDVIVVTPNYRTNIFGFPGSPDKPDGEQNLG